MAAPRQSKSYDTAYSRAMLRGDWDRVVELQAVPLEQRATWKPTRRKPARTMTHRQYEALRGYPAELGMRVIYREGGHAHSLFLAGYLHQYSDGSVGVTDAGRDAMKEYRQRWGVKS